MMCKIVIVALFLFLSPSSIFGQKGISRNEALADIDSLVSVLNRVHYNPYLHISKKDFDHNVNVIKQSLSDSISFKKYLLNLYKLTAVMQDGHSMPFIVQPVLVPELGLNNFIPFKFIFNNNAVYISKSDYEKLGIPFGAEITTINKIPLLLAINEYRSLFGGSDNFKKEIATRLMGYFLFLNDVHPPFTIAYTVKGKKPQTITLQDGVTFMEMLQKSLPQLKEKNNYKIIEGKIAYLTYISMDGDINEWGVFLDSVFNDIRTNKISKLCIDIRNNSGGNSLFNNYLLAYITKNKFLQASGKSWRISDDYKKYQQENGSYDTAYQSRVNGSVWNYENCTPENNPVIADSIFNGKVYLLTGAFTFSSANMLADAFKTFHIGMIIGESTGEYTNDFGEVMSIILLNSKIKMQVTTSFEYGADCNKQDFHTISPDIKVVPSLESQLNENDEVLQYIMNLN